MILPLILIVISSIWIMKACEPFEDASDYLGRNLGAGVKGATINAVGSSLPELFVTIISLFVLKDSAGFGTGIATSVGSAIYNAAVIPALVILTVIVFTKNTSIVVRKRVILRDGIFYVISLLAFIKLLQSPEFTWYMGLLLIFIYVVYTVILIKSSKSDDTPIISQPHPSVIDREENEPNRVIAFLKFEYKEAFVGNGQYTDKTAWLALLLSIVHIGVATYFLTDSVVKLGEIWNIPVFFVAVILAAAATSLPDTILSIKDGLKGNYEDALSNAFGSNIFNITIGLGLPVFVYTLVFQSPLAVNQSDIAGVTELILVLLIITTLIIPFFVVPKKIGLKISLIVLGGYLLFVSYVVSLVFKLPWATNINNAIGNLLN